MKITKLKASNFLNIKCIEIDPPVNGDPVVLSGSNGVGKSSVLNSICAVMQGGKAKMDQPIRHGEERAEIIAQTEKWAARRVFTHKNPSGTLEVTSNDGAATFNSPQKFLDQVWGDLTFDPLEFKELNKKDPKKARAIIMDLAGLDFTTQNEERAQLFTERTAQNKEVTRLNNLLQSMPPFHPDAPEQEIAVEDILRMQEDYERGKEAYDAHLVLIKDAERHHREGEASVEEAKKVIAQWQEELRLREEAVVNRLQRLKELQGTVPQEFTDEDIAKIKQRHTERDGTNQKVRDNKARQETQDLFEAAQAEGVKLSTAIANIDHDKNELLTKASFPLPGLSVSDDAVLYEGIPFSQISEGQAIRVSTAIAMALNPSLQVVFIRNASPARS